LTQEAATPPRTANPPQQAEPGREADPCWIRVLYRDSAGQIQLHWPIEKLRDALNDAEGIVWVDIEDPACNSSGTPEAILRDVFQFHPLAIEDALKETHVPKVDDWGDYLYLVFQTIDHQAERGHIKTHELDIFLGKNYLVTYHTDPLPCLEQDRKNIERDSANRLRRGADHLLYHFLDAAVAEYFPVIEHMDLAIDDAQEEVFKSPTPSTLQEIFRVKRTALRLHRVIAPEREVLNRLARDAYDPIAEEHRVYFRDVYDHLVRVHDLTESLRDLISGALDTYLSAISNRTNDVMRTLTLVTVMFLPMSFLTGFFGMNYFGETLNFHSPLPKVTLFVITSLVMIGSFVGQWYWAKKKGWL
jgi:magnesium transporter